MAFGPKYLLIIIILMFVLYAIIDYARFDIARDKLQTNLNHLARKALTQTIQVNKNTFRLRDPQIESLATLNNILQGDITQSLTFVGMPVQVIVTGESTNPPMIQLQATGYVHSWLFAVINAWAHGKSIITDTYPIIVRTEAIAENKSTKG